MDDEPAVRKGLRLRLSAEPDMTIVGECGGGQYAVDLVRALKPDVVVLEIHRPQLRGEAKASASAVHHAHAGSLIFALTSGEDPALCAQAAELGFVGCLSKESLCDEWVSTLRTVVQGVSKLEAEPAPKAGDATPPARSPPGQTSSAMRRGQGAERGSSEKHA